MKKAHQSTAIERDLLSITVWTPKRRNFRNKLEPISTSGIPERAILNPKRISPKGQREPFFRSIPLMKSFGMWPFSGGHIPGPKICLWFFRYPRLPGNGHFRLSPKFGLNNWGRLPERIAVKLCTKLNLHFLFLFTLIQQKKGPSNVPG